MRLSEAQVDSYCRDGFLIFENHFSKEEVEILRAETRREFAQDSPRVIKEKSGAIRSVYASHFSNEVFRRFSLLQRLVEPARQLLGSDVYIHQFKINAKVALEGDQWEWHQDFLYWHKEDGMLTPRVLTAAVFLQDVDDFNGPMLLIPGSHTEGMINLEPQPAQPDVDVSAWMPTLTADLKYKINRDILRRLLKKNSIFAVKGGAGLTVFFQGNVFHASPNNLSANDRWGVFVTYNSVHNRLLEVENPRPNFIANRDFTPIATAHEDLLIEKKIVA